MDHCIKVEVSTQFLQGDSDPEQNRFVYAYQISITNEGRDTAQLISRRWSVINALGEKQEIAGLGVVGQQPVLYAGQTYTYSSGVILSTDSGHMEGTYLFKDEDGEEFEAPIPAFSLVQAQALH